MLNMAIVGCGRISDKHVKAAIDNMDKIKLVAVCDIQAVRAEKRAEEYYNKINSNKEIAKSSEFIPKPTVYTDYKDMITNENIDFISICTESGYHAQHAIDCINHGKHVIVEKPMALSIGDASAMIDAAKNCNVKLCVSHQNRFNPSIQKLREALDSGRFGKIIAGHARILWNRGKNYYDQAPWRGTYELDGGCLMNQCIHNIDLLQWMLGGRIKWVNGDVNNYIHQYIEAEDYGCIQIKFENDAIGSVEGTICIYPKNLKEELTIIGEKGVATIGGLAVNKIETWRFEDGLDKEEDIIAEYNLEIDSVYGSGHTPLYKDFIDSVENDRQPYINGDEGRKALAIILAAYKSSYDNIRVPFPVGNISSVDFK